MPVIWGDSESIVTRRNIPPSLIVTTRTPLGAYRVECVVEKNTGMARDIERLSLEEIRPGDFVVATLGSMPAGWKLNGSTSSCSESIQPLGLVKRGF